jgi:hypothetical protein
LGIDFYLANRESEAAKSSALLILIRSMVAYAGDPQKDESAVQAFDRLRTRWVSMAEAIGKQKRFDAFVGLTVDEEEKE